MLLFDFQCTRCADTFEELVQKDVKNLECPRCGYVANRLISAPRMDPRLGVDPDHFPTMGDRWAKVREQRQKIESKRHLEHGD